jgi:hypothetical protein
MTALCAPTFVFLAGTSLALSIERKVQKGIDGWEIDKGSHPGRHYCPTRSHPHFVRLRPLEHRSAECDRPLDDLYGLPPTTAVVGVVDCGNRLDGARRSRYSVGVAPTRFIFETSCIVRRELRERCVADQVSVVSVVGNHDCGMGFRSVCHRFQCKEARAFAEGHHDHRRSERLSCVCRGPLPRRLWRHVSAPFRQFLAAVVIHQQVSTLTYLLRFRNGDTLSRSRHLADDRATHWRPTEWCVPGLRPNRDVLLPLTSLSA